MTRRVLLILVAILEILSGLAGLLLVVGANLGINPAGSRTDALVWVLSGGGAWLLVCLLLLRLKHGFALSVSGSNCFRCL